MKRIVDYLKDNLRIKVILFTLVVGLIIVALGYTYAFFQVKVEKENAFTMIVANLDYTITSSSLNDENQITVGSGKRKTFEVEIENKNEIETDFKLYYTCAESNDVIVSYTPNDVIQNGVGKLSSKGKVTITISIQNNSSNPVTITLGAQGGLKNKELVLKQGKELIEQEDICGSSPNEPVLVEGQIPVIYDSTKSSWVKSDITSDWYNYCNQEWANAVTVTDATRNTYMNASSGTAISMNDINTMWVWIPRYEYMYTNLGTQYAGGTAEAPGEIRINFLDGKEIVPSNTSHYKIHPAFTFGEDKLEGIWFAKFETGGSPSSSCQNESCNVDSVVIKPSVTSLRSQNVSSFFYMARSMQMNDSSPFGFSKTGSDLHMSKNSEWGSVAYLSQSKYGKYGNSIYKSNEKEIRNNNCSSYITGTGANYQNEEATSTACSNTYETVKGQKASTTGNISGIYDMSGGAWEYVMGVLADPSGNPRSGFSSSSNSGFNGMLSDGSMYTGGLSFPEAKYYSLYTSDDPTSYAGVLSETACNGGICFGYSLSETGEWYGDFYQFVFASSPWFTRGGTYIYGANSGIFASFHDQGYVYVIEGTRLVLVPTV